MPTIRLASLVDLDRVRDAYVAWGYNGGVTESDLVYVAESSGALIGVVRRTREHGVTLLRGMHVAPTHQRRGVGSGLLAAFTQDLAGTECWCLPYTHLVSFYSSGGFTTVPHLAAPTSLQHRLAEYRARGLDVLVMLRR
jgi:GNAT superfamily N-acetyltransferase